ncbi:MAG: hypothetical protein A2Y17_11565 [Clostridiales bacterium GWF2_38_85]|nr:MAG: hypothetical protein A2Y17_11565 [Clostridiales bacterium GWF2_38_85]HBL83990.1 hypothetical protein [Clostridiales bacterium]
MKNFISILISYLKRNRAIIIAYIIIYITFTVVFSLYSLPVEAVLYAAAMSFFFIAILASIRFYKFYKHHNILHHMAVNITASIGELPEPVNSIEADYRELLLALNRERIDLISEHDRNFTDMTDYYTMWVHQIKTPIAAMRLILQSEKSEQNIELSAQLFKIEQYVEMVLGYMRSENMSSDLVIRKCPLDDIVKQAIRKYSASFIRKKLPLQYVESGITVLTDEKWLCFVIEQIISNSLKYTHNGKISIYMDKDTENTLVIEDTGIGISPEDIPRLGEKGFTGYNGHENKKSTGIGLYLCKKILKKLSHIMTVESVLGEGTKVRIGFITEEFKHE